MREGSVSEVNVLTSPMTSCSSPGGAPSMKEDAISIVEDMMTVMVLLDLISHSLHGLDEAHCSVAMRLSFTCTTQEA